MRRDNYRLNVRIYARLGKVLTDRSDAVPHSELQTSLGYKLLLSLNFHSNLATSLDPFEENVA